MCSVCDVKLQTVARGFSAVTICLTKEVGSFNGSSIYLWRWPIILVSRDPTLNLQDKGVIKFTIFGNMSLDSNAFSRDFLVFATETVNFFCEAYYYYTINHVVHSSWWRRLCSRKLWLHRGWHQNGTFIYINYNIKVMHSFFQPDRNKNYVIKFEFVEVGPINVLLVLYQCIYDSPCLTIVITLLVHHGKL